MNRFIINKETSDYILKLIKDDNYMVLQELIGETYTVNDILQLEFPMPDFVFENPTIFHMCCYFNSRKCIEFLKDNVDLSITDSNDRNWLHYAACSGSFESIRVFNIYEKEKITVFCQADKNGLTPAHYAAIFGKLDFIKYLESHEVNIFQVEDKENRSPIHLACMYGHIDVIQYLFEKNKVEDIQSLLGYTIKNGQSEVLKYLIKNNIDINTRIDGMTPVCCAAKYGHLPVIKILFANGAQKQLEETNRLPLIDASLNGHADVVRFLLQQNCDPNLCDERRISPLHAAAISKSYYTFKLLVQNGAIIQLDYQQKKVIHIKKYCKKQLYEAEIEINDFTDESFKILQVICQNDDVKAFKLICDENIISKFIENDEELYQKKRVILLRIHSIIKKEGNRYTDSIYWGTLPKLDSSCSFFSSSKNKKESEEEEEEEESDELEEDHEGLSDRSIFQIVEAKGHFTFSPRINDPQILNLHYGRRFILMNTAIEANSINIFKFLIQQKLYPSDLTDIYINCIRLVKYEFIKYMLDNDLPFENKDDTLCKLASSIKDQTIYKQFLHKYIDVYERPLDSMFSLFSEAQFECQTSNEDG